MTPDQAAEISDRILSYVLAEVGDCATCDSAYYDWSEEAIDYDTLLDEARQLRDYLREVRK